MKALSTYMKSFLVIFLITTDICASSNDATSVFQEWFSSNGGLTSGLGLGTFTGVGRGVLVEKDIISGQEVLFVPSSMIFSANSAQNSPDELHRKLAKIFVNHEELVIALILLEKCRGDQSFWKPYLDILPDYVPNLNTFSKSELAELQDPSFADEVVQGWQRLASQMHQFRQKAAPIWPCDIDQITMNEYLWASSIVDSRGFRLQGSVNLAPFADMFNYRPHPQTRAYNGGNFFLKHHRLSKTGLQVVADRYVRA